MTQFLLTRYTDLIIQLNYSWNYLKQIYLKEYRRFQNEVLINVLECGLCRSFSCGENHKKFFLGCDRCKKARCQPCIIFNIAK